VMPPLRSDTTFNVYLRALKLLLEDADRNLSEREYAELLDVLRIVGRN
jgi:hypothetical protein